MTVAEQEKKTGKTDTATEVVEAPDARLVGIAVAMVPAHGVVQPTVEQLALAEDMEALVDEARKKAEADLKASSTNQEAHDQASARFFAAEVAKANADARAAQGEKPPATPPAQQGQKKPEGPH